MAFFFNKDNGRGVTAQDFLTSLEWVLNFHKNDAANTSMPMEMIAGAEDYYNMNLPLQDRHTD